MKSRGLKGSWENLWSIWHLLRQNISKGQLIGYIASNLVGLSIILTAVLFYQDSRTGNNEEDVLVSRDYIVLSKKVSGLEFTPVTFTDEDIAQLGEQPWVERIGEFTSSQFTVRGMVNVGPGLSSYMFFESIPDYYFDIKPQGWKFNPEDNFIPIILSKDYLALYNFGFAIPQGFPQLSESIMSSIPIVLQLSGTNHWEETFDARVVGFSSRLNTIAVPQDFMDWANRRYAPGKERSNPSRLIVEVNSPGDPKIKEYLVANELEAGGEKAEAGRFIHFIKIVTVVVSVVGIIICLLALFILLLSIYLLIQKNREKLRNLMLLGYSPRAIGRCYELLVCMINVVIGVVACVVAVIAHCLWSQSLQNLGLGEASMNMVILIATLFVIVISVVNIVIIRRHMLKIWNA